MADVTHPDRAGNRTSGSLPGAPASGRTERLVRETWRHYYVARLAEAQFGPDSLEASIAQSRALSSYRELRGSLRELDPYYRSPEQQSSASSRPTRHLTLVREDAAGPDRHDEA
jgi:hypothetical protein